MGWEEREPSLPSSLPVFVGLPTLAVSCTWAGFFSGGEGKLVSAGDLKTTTSGRGLGSHKEGRRRRKRGCRLRAKRIRGGLRLDRPMRTGSRRARSLGASAVACPAVPARPRWPGFHLRMKWRAREEESIAEDGQRAAEKRASKGEGDEWQGLGPGFRLSSASAGSLSPSRPGGHVSQSFSEREEGTRRAAERRARTEPAAWARRTTDRDAAVALKELCEAIAV
jgi:hypothetical protein